MDIYAKIAIMTCLTTLLAMIAVYAGNVGTTAYIVTNAVRVQRTFVGIVLTQRAGIFV